MKKRYLPALAAACALLSAFAAGPALAGGGLSIPAPLTQSVTNTTDQSNQATAINVPILSGNNVSVLSKGDQSNSAGVDQDQTNLNATDQDASQSGSAAPASTQTTSNSTDQSNHADAVNVPILSGNNVSVLSKGDQSNSAGVDQDQTNVNATSQQASQTGSSSGDPENSTDQSNHADAVNVPIASGNNVSVLSKGDQSNSTGVDQDQTNVNVTKQDATQSGASKPDGRCDTSSSGSKQEVENSTDQSNRAKAINVPIVSGNNVSVLSSGKQSNSAGVEQTQTNVNLTKQEASQSGSSKSDGWYGKKSGGSKQEVENSTEQSNRAEAINVPIVSGNNVSVLSSGKQSNSAGVEQTQTNVNLTKQEATQSGSSYSTEQKRCKEQKDTRFESGKQSVRNWTEQENKAKAINVPIVSGNNVSVLSKGGQRNSAGVEQTQTNVNDTAQQARLRL